MINISSYKDISWAIIRPLSGGVVTKRDKKKLGDRDFYPMRSHYMTILFPTRLKNEFLDKIKKVKLSKKMLVTIITDAQFGLNGKKPATIVNTPFYATKKQLSESFTIG